MVNYKRVVCEVAVMAAVLAIVTAAPAPNCTENHDHYDQRQNGTDNIRVNIDGVVIAAAPAESLIEALLEFSGLVDVSDIEEALKPPSSGSKPGAVSSSGSKPEKPAEAPLSDVSLTSETKAQRKDASVGKQDKVKRLKNRLANVLVPLLRRTLHQ